MVLSSAIVCDRDRRISDDRRSMFPYADRRRSQTLLRSAICDPRSYGNQPLANLLFTKQLLQNNQRMNKAVHFINLPFSDNVRKPHRCLNQKYFLKRPCFVTIFVTFRHQQLAAGLVNTRPRSASKCRPREGHRHQEST